MNQVALITGASRGIGRGIALELAAMGWDLVVNYAGNQTAAEDTAKRCVEQAKEAGHTIRAEICQCDVGQAADRDRLIAFTREHFGRLDLLVNNAGMGDYGEFTTGNWEKLEQMLSLNITAVTHLAHGFLPGMIRSGHGAVLNVSSLASLLPIPDFAVYAASKAYVTSFSEALRLELQAHDIPVVAVCPGPVHTGFGGIAGREGSPEETPMREWFFVSKEEVVLEALLAVQREQPRSYPGLQISLLAAVLAFMPPSVLRYFMRNRPRAVSYTHLTLPTKRIV